MKRALLVSILALCAGSAAAHEDFVVDLRAPGGTRWVVSTRDATRSGQMPAGSGMVGMTTTVFGYLNHDGREFVDATFEGPGGDCDTVVVGVFEPQNHFELTCRPTFTYDGASCVSTCPTTPSPVPQPPIHSAAAEPLAFPNPLRAPGEMHFTNLPGNSRVRIYSSAGQLVFEQTIAADGHMSWHAQDNSGRAVGSGIYHVVAQGAGKTVTLNIAVQR